MSLDTFSNLSASIETWLDKRNLTSSIADFITLAENRLNKEKDFDPSWLEKISHLVVSTSETDFGLPYDFNGIRTIKVTTNPVKRLRYIQPDSANFQNLENDNSGNPNYFTIVGNRLRILPKPSFGMNIQMVYTFKPIPLSNSNETNEFLINSPDALLYATLLETKPFLFDDKRLSTWTNLYREAISNIIDRDENNKFGDTPLEMSTEYGCVLRGASTG